MSGYPGEALQAGIYAALKADGTLMGAIDDIYDHVPSNSPFPYLVIGEMNATNFDDKTSDGADTTFNLHVFSRKRDKREVHQIFSHIHDVLHNGESNVTVSGHTLILIRWDNFATIVRENTDNMITYHGIMRYRALTREV